MWLISLALLSALLLAIYLQRYILTPRRSLLLNLPGPPSESFLWGSLKAILKAEPGDAHDDLFAKYGPTIQYTAFLGEGRFCTIDPRAVNQ